MTVDAIYARLYEQGVRCVCLCPGARNAAFVKKLPKTMESINFFEERSAGFFALGRIQQTKKPVAVIITSGTAVGELLPAVMEAYYAMLPLIVVSADRPKRFRGSGSPQVAEQEGIFGFFAETYEADWVLDNRPIHINVFLEDPIPRPPLLEVTERAGHYPLCLLGALDANEYARLRAVLPRDVPLLAESLSGFWDTSLQEIRLLDRLREAAYPVDCIYRFGGLPTSRLWRDLESFDIPVISWTKLPFPGLARPSVRYDLSCETFLELLDKRNRLDLSFFDRDAELKNSLHALLERFPASEPALMKRAAEALVTKEGSVFLGNSLPIRIFDLVCSHVQAKRFYASRGLSGIDGQLSTFLGTLDGSSCIGFFGDLTALYDLAAPWVMSQVKAPFVICIMNNHGGRIFDRLFHGDARFQNEHNFDFSGWAEMFGMRYVKIDGAAAIIAEQAQVYELVPDYTQTQAFWEAYDRF